MSRWNYYKLGSLELYWAWWGEWDGRPPVCSLERGPGELQLWLGKLEVVVSWRCARKVAAQGS
jgi:hypothetical protein